METKNLVGKKVKLVRHLYSSEMRDFGWYKRPVVIFFEDGTFIIPQADDEGNDGGALMIGDQNNPDYMGLLGTL